jgi:Fe2+ or Zn2+ uptake regulation protein
MFCGRVDDIRENSVAEVLEDFQGLANYKIVGFRLEFEGICPGCQSGRDSSGEPTSQNHGKDVSLRT